MKKALITGITGQDGSYLVELLLSKGYEVHGIIRRASTFNTERIDHLYQDAHVHGVRMFLHYGDLSDSVNLVKLLFDLKPDEIYHLAAQSHVRVSFDIPEYTSDVTAVGTIRILEAIRETGIRSRFYQASSSEMFGKVLEVPQTEKTPFWPRSPYGVAKAYGHFITVNYRESYDLHATSGILFNHESICSNTPILIREDGIIAVRTPADLVPLLRKGGSVQSFLPKTFLEIWDGDGWTPITTITATRRRTTDPDHELLSIQARAGVVEVTAHHNMLSPEFEKVPATEVERGDELALAEEMPSPADWSVATFELAEFLGLMAADGYVHRDGTQACFTNNDALLRTRAASLWSQLFLGKSREWSGTSGWSEDASVEHVDLTGSPAVGPWLREQLYTSTGFKQVPPLILNAD